MSQQRRLVALGLVTKGCGAKCVYAYNTWQHMVFGELGSALKAVVDDFQKSEAGAVAMGGKQAGIHVRCREACAM